jgi:electron transport complex protein RnfD
MTQTNEKRPYILSNAPHIFSDQSLTKIMWLVFIALMPAAINSFFVFGFNAFLLMLTCILSAMSAEALVRYLLKRNITVSNGSAAITGLLLAMNLPPEFPIWMAAIGSIFAIIIVKELFGGIGFNIFNPALAGRAFLMSSYQTEMTTKWHTFSPKNMLSPVFDNPETLKATTHALTSATKTNSIDAITGATPLSLLNDTPDLFWNAETFNQLCSKDMLQALFTGNVGGCIGETSALFILLGAIFLLFKKIINWQIPLAFIGTFASIIFAYYFFKDFHAPGTILLYHLLSGGLMLGAFFMATDMITSPTTSKGMLIFGVGCGLLTAVIRLWGGYPEGVSYAILLMNAVVPLIDRYVKPFVFGASK